MTSMGIIELVGVIDIYINLTMESSLYRSEGVRFRLTIGVLLRVRVIL